MITHASVRSVGSTFLLALVLLSGLVANSASASSNPTSSGANFSTFASAVGSSSMDTLKLMNTTQPLASLPTQTSLVQSSQANLHSTPGQTPVAASSSAISSAAESSSGVPIVSAAEVANNNGGAATAKGLNAYDSFGVNGFDAEPPDQGLCAGNGYVVEPINTVVTVYSTSFKHLSSDVSLATLIGFPIDQLFGISSVGGGYDLFDPRCLHDPMSGHWFLSFTYLGGAGVYSSGGPFPLGPHTYGAEFVLASTTTSPLGSYNVYLLNVTNTGRPGHPNCPCFGDQPLLGSDANSVILSTNEYPVFCGTGCFNGGQVYLFDKLGLVNGFSVVNVVAFNTGLLPTPDGNCQTANGLNCWWSVNPANSPTVGSYDTSDRGTAWAISVLDFQNNAFGVSKGDNRIAIWSFSNTASLHSFNPLVTLTLVVGTNLEHYTNPIFSKDTIPSGNLIPQKAGPIPLGDVVYSNNGTGVGCNGACPEGKLASNDDRIGGSVVYAQGAIWGALNTVVNEGTATSRNKHGGAAFFIVNAVGDSISLASQGYVAAENAGIDFPAFAVGPSGNAVMTFTLSGEDYYPSTAYARIGRSSTGPVGNVIYVSARGQSPQDSFSEYQCINDGSVCTHFGVPYRPRWGDYSYAVWNDGKFFFAGEYIQYPNCSDQAFAADPSCGGTRSAGANWGSSLNSLS